MAKVWSLESLRAIVGRGTPTTAEKATKVKPTTKKYLEKAGYGKRFQCCNEVVSIPANVNVTKKITSNLKTIMIPHTSNLIDLHLTVKAIMVPILITNRSYNIFQY